MKSERVFKTKGSGYVQSQVGSSQGRKRNRKDIKGMEKRGLLGSMEGRSEKLTLEEKRHMIKEWREG